MFARRLLPKTDAGGGGDGGATGGNDGGAPEPKLSKRELEVVRKCAAGVPLVEIARQANRSSKTISAQKSMAMRKLGLTSDYELYQYAVTYGMLAAAQ